MECEGTGIADSVGDLGIDIRIRPNILVKENKEMRTENRHHSETKEFKKAHMRTGTQLAVAATRFWVQSVWTGRWDDDMRVAWRRKQWRATSLTKMRGEHSFK